MSRIGKKPILIPSNVKITITNCEILIKGNLGILKQKIPKYIKLHVSNKQLEILRTKNTKVVKSLHGLYRVLINNMIIGVSIGFQKKLELVGIGYRATCIDNNVLDLNLGFSHNIMIQLPENILIDIKIEKGKNTIIILKSCDKQLLGIIASKIRSFRKPEPYKGKGIRYLGENIRRKTGKSA
ncbi:50S ribosomal protein L6 [Blattabacterium cuenoti]|uniref:50S ribosomal protein L6 n=1 Tax=Blattabacterium cuenoti TaxID=1653831 RepID=UPI00163CD128|nr:50S ribosomal protein L6 [Blattabacterium cuenoti]